jgi:hypothetical protein
MSGIGPVNYNQAILNLMNAGLNQNETQVPQSTSISGITPKAPAPLYPDLGLAGTPFKSNNQPLTVSLLGTTVKQMDAQDAVSLGGSGKGEGAGESSGEGAGEGARSGRSSSNRRSKAGE